ARGNDGQGVCGAAWNCRVMPLKIFTDDGTTNTFLVAAALRYAADNGADVVNMSFSIGIASDTVRAAVAYALTRACILVAAAGTSFSSPIAAGLAALVISRDKDLHGGVRTISAADVIDIIERTARPLPDDPNDNPDAGATWDGHGRLDFFAAVTALTGSGRA